MQKEYRVDLHGVEDGEDDESLGASKVNPEAGQQQECCEPWKKRTESLNLSL